MTKNRLRSRSYLLMGAMVLPVLVISCATVGDRINPKHTGIAPEAVSYMAYFEEHVRPMTADEKESLSVGFEDLKGDTAGICHYLLDGKIEIALDIDFWARYPEEVKTALVLHEIGHCVCFLPHDRAMIDKACPGTFMYPQMADSVCYLRYWKDYMQSLKKGCQQE